ncbi:MAG: hypothetical protein QM820_63735 [Minicystis sp.]
MRHRLSGTSSFAKLSGMFLFCAPITEALTVSVASVTPHRMGRTRSLATRAPDALRPRIMASPTASAYSELEQRFRRRNLLRDAAAVLDWDTAAMMPAGRTETPTKKGAKKRAPKGQANLFGGDDE